VPSCVFDISGCAAGEERLQNTVLGHNFKQSYTVCGLDLSSRGEELMEGCCKHSNEALGS
jgi:hypothetical protein